MQNDSFYGIPVPVTVFGMIIIVNYLSANSFFSVCLKSAKKLVLFKTYADLGVFQVLGGPVLHTEEDAFKKVEAEDGEPLEQAALPLLCEAERTNESQGGLDVLNKGVGVAL